MLRELFFMKNNKFHIVLLNNEYDLILALTFYTRILQTNMFSIRFRLSMSNANFVKTFGWHLPIFEYSNDVVDNNIEFY